MCLITAASSSVGLAAIQIVNAECGTPIATTRKSNKRAELLALGAAHVIAIDEEDLVAKVKEITGGNGASIPSPGRASRNWPKQPSTTESFSYKAAFPYSPRRFRL